MGSSISQKEQIIRYPLEYGSEFQQFFLPLYDFENKFCERCEIDDNESKYHCS
jgi:hypothetical protein